MKRAQVIQYVAAFLTFIGTVLMDPEVREWLADHPWPALSMIAGPSFITLLRAITRALRRGKPVPASEANTNPIEVRK